jgi:prepilin-type N-terminal cleavage/methylation domain-containing protein
MRKIAKSNKRGFTMIELVLVVSIIVMLAAVLAINAGDIYARSRNKADQASDQVNNFVGGVAGSEDLLKNSYHF